LQGGSVTRTFSSQDGSLTVSNGNPPRGKFDLWDLGADILIRDQYPHALHLLDVLPYEDEMRKGLIPVRTTEEDLIAAYKIAASRLLATGRCVFVLLKTGEPEEHYVKELASVGPVAPVLFSFRDVQPRAFES
jgi:hypothetical protein